jgi:hypothetical protein
MMRVHYARLLWLAIIFTVSMSSDENDLVENYLVGEKPTL